MNRETLEIRKKIVFRGKKSVKKSLAMLFIIGSMLMLLSGCTGGSNNKIRLANLTVDQQDIVNLLVADSQEVFIFNYQTANASAMELWVGVYAYGELVESMAGLSFSRSGNQSNSLSGRLAVTINYETDGSFVWTFAVIDGNFHATNIVEFTSDSESFGSRTHSPMQEAIAIQDGKDIILHTTKFHSDTVFTDGSRNSQDYINQPELLAGYQYVILIRARFSMQIL